MKKKKIANHVDSDWINKKINGKGGCFSYNTAKGRARISYIGGTSKLKIAYYNFILLIKAIKRKYK